MAEEVRSNADFEVSAIYEIGKILSSSLDLPKTFREVLNLLVGHLRIRRGMVSLVQESGELHLVGAVGMSANEILRGRYRPGEGLTGRIFSTAMACVVPNVAKEPLFLNRTGSLDEIGEDGDVAFVGVPIKAGRETVGVLSIIRAPDRRRRSFEQDRQFLMMVANLIGQTAVLHRTVTADRIDLLRDRTRLQKQLNAPPRGKIALEDVIGVSPVMQKVFAEVHQAAPSRATVLLRGESGTGKEAIARAIHVQSARKGRPFIKVNCSSMPSDWRSNGGQA